MEEKAEKKEALKFIEPYFRDLERRAVFLPQLRQMGYRGDALLLCCCYIEAMGNIFYGGNRNQYNFFRVLKEYSGEGVLIQILPKQLWLGLKHAGGKNLSRIGKKIEGVLKKHRKKFYRENEILALVNSTLNPTETEKLKKNPWRGTLASAAYMHLRNPLVHEMGGVEFSFDRITFKGKPAPVLGFSLLYKAMRNILSKMKEKSIESGTFFGQDFDSLLRSGLAIHKEWEGLK